MHLIFCEIFIENLTGETLKINSQGLLHSLRNLESYSVFSNPSSSKPCSFWKPSYNPFPSCAFTKYSLQNNCELFAHFITVVWHLLLTTLMKSVPMVPDFFFSHTSNSFTEQFGQHFGSLFRCRVTCVMEESHVGYRCHWIGKSNICITEGSFYP